MLTLGLAGWLAGLVEERVYKDNWLLPLGAGALGFVLKEGLTIAVLTAFDWKIPLMASVRGYILPGALFNGLICLVIYFRILRHYQYFRPDPRGQIFFVRKR